MSKEIITIEGWKGKGNMSISQDIDEYTIIEFRKNKESMESYENEHTIPKENVDKLLKIIVSSCEVGREYKYKFLVRKILEFYKFHEEEEASIEIFMEAFNGGKNRAKYYFPYLYYPLKVLEAKGIITYFGRGGIMLNQNG